MGPGGWLVGHVRTSRRVGTDDTQAPVEALLPPDALLQVKLPTAEWNLSLAGPQALAASQPSPALESSHPHSSFGMVDGG